MPEQKGNVQSVGVQIKTATVSSTKMAVAVAFLGAAALAAAAVGTSIRRVEQMAKVNQSQYGYAAPVRKVETMAPLYGYNQPVTGYGYNMGTGDLGYGYNAGTPSSNNPGGSVGYGYNTGSNGLWCAYGMSNAGYGFAPRSSNYCAPVKTLKECTVMIKGLPFTSLEDCKKYLSAVGKK